MATLLAAPVVVRGQDAAVEERMNKISAQLDELKEARDAQNRRIEELAKQLREVQEQAGKPAGNYASAEDVKELAAKLKEVDEKRVQDNERIVTQIEKLGKTLSSPVKAGGGKTSATPAGAGIAPVPANDKGYEYVVQSGDTLSVIVAAYREKNIKVTVDQILKANPGLQPEKMKVGQKIFIPAPAL